MSFGNARRRIGQTGLAIFPASTGVGNGAVMTGATAVTAGTQGAAPSPAAGEQVNFLRGDGTWQPVAGADTDVVQVPDGGTVSLGHLNEIADSGAVSVPAAAGNTNAIFSVMLAEGGTSATVGAPINLTLTDPLQVVSFRSDGTTWDRFGAEEDPDFFSVVQIADAGTIEINRVNEIADGATVNIPAPAPGNVNQTFAVFLTEGGTSATLGAPLNQVLNTPFQQINFRSDGVSWDSYGAVGASIPTGSNGSIPVQSGGAYTAQQVTHTTGHQFRGSGNGEVLRIPITLPFIIDQVSVSVSANSADFSAFIDTGPGTAQTAITGIQNVSASTVALTTGTATAANTGAAGEYLVVSFSSVATTVDGFIESRFRWTGV